MKVLHVIPSISKVHGGPSRALEIIESALTSRGIEVTTATTDDDGPGRRLTSEEQPSLANGATRYYAAKLTDFYKVSPRLVGWLTRNVPTFDIIHIHALFSFASVAAAFVAHHHRVPYVVRPLGTLNTYGIEHRRPMLKRLSFRYIERRILAHAAAVHFTSQNEWEEAERLGLTLRGVVVPLGVVGPELGSDVSVPLGIDPGEKVVLFLSRLDPKKNVEGLIRAFALLRPCQRARLVIAGSGERSYVQSLRELAAYEGVAESIDWIGHVEGAVKWGVLKAADVFVLPSFSENFGIAAVGAMIAGCPCVVGRGVAISQTMAMAGAGLITEPEPGAIANALARLLGDSVLRADMSAQAQKLASETFSSDKMAERLAQVYSRIVAIGFRPDRARQTSREI